MKHAQGTFLWVALVCANLSNVPKRRAKETLVKFPSTLDEVYSRMLQHVKNSEEANILIRILTLAGIIYRPVRIQELENLIETSQDNLDSMDKIVKECGSFLTIREDFIEFVHQSASEYIRKHLLSEAAIVHMHTEVYTYSLNTLIKRLRRDMYGIQDDTIHSRDIIVPDPSPLSTIEYSCLHWVQHLREAGIIQAQLSNGTLLYQFMHRVYLYWLEAVSLLEQIPHALLSMHTLHTIAKVG